MTNPVTNRLNDIIRAIDERREGKERVVVALDGRSAAGKTTFALELGSRVGATVIHLDHFFLRPEQRTEERLSEPGGNVDYERFLSEVLLPLVRGIPFSYRPFDCKIMEFRDPIEVIPGDTVVIEGAYACHPRFREHYDLTVFLSIDPAEQLKRILEREGEMTARVFRERWIPMEERYIAFYQIPEHCDMVFNVCE
ncbi:MAG: uridine kinase family protein [Saccharofermentanales bacterium]|jgi:uridine kinase